MSGCICEGNWRYLIAKYEPYFDRKFIQKNTSNVFTLTGILWASDDFYYVLNSEFPEDDIYHTCCSDLFDEFKLMEE